MKNRCPDPLQLVQWLESQDENITFHVLNCPRCIAALCLVRRAEACA